VPGSVPKSGNAFQKRKNAVLSRLTISLNTRALPYGSQFDLLWHTLNRTQMNYLSFIENTRLLNALLVLISFSDKSTAQNCPANVPVTITANPDTYYPGLDSMLSIGSNSITLGASGYGTTPIASGDLLLLIQMQGAQINNANSASYGDGATGHGYLSNSALLAGNMEYVVATNALPLSGGTLSIMSGTTNKYKNADYGTDGQYRYQVIRIGLYYNLTLGATITTPAWNGTSGGLLVLSVTNNLNFNGQKLTAASAGFRGGGGRQLSGATGGLNTDLVTLSTKNFNASKGEGIAGTPRFINNNGSLYDKGLASEGYPGGSYAAGAPGNAGGGGTDGRPASNDQNSGGGGGANGGVGGRGGNSWSSNLSTGGNPGALFQEKSPSRLVMGGGGGAGTTNDGTGSSAAGFSSSGVAGGGIVLVNAGTITGTGSIDVSGASGNITVVNDGSGGGGAGGSVLIYATSGHSGVTVLATGGTGGSNKGGGSPPPHGPGGGGGGGIIYSNAPVNAASNVAAGPAGTTTGAVNYGATPGASGVLVENVTIQQVPAQNLNCSVLPVRFKSVSATRQQKKVIVNWQVTNEIAVKNYTVEKSTDGKNFRSAGVVQYNYTSASDNSYTLTDPDYSLGSTYYRIKELAEGGNSMYSIVVNVTEQEDGTPESVSLSPNPAVSSTASIRFTLKSIPVNKLILRMISVNGAIVWQKQYKAAAGINAVTIENLTAIPNGLYFVQYTNNGDAVNLKMIVSH
jgi:hypothetical protein